MKICVHMFDEVKHPFFTFLLHGWNAALYQMEHGTEHHCYCVIPFVSRKIVDRSRVCVSCIKPSIEIPLVERYDVIEVIQKQKISTIFF
jgi:hypothetical protein